MPLAEFFSTPDAPDLPRETISNLANLKTWVADASYEDLFRTSRALHHHLEAQREIIDTELNHRRHILVQRQLSELSKPHWTVLPNFWIILITAIAAILAAYFAWRAITP